MILPGSCDFLVFFSFNDMGLEVGVHIFFGFSIRCYCSYLFSVW